MNNTIGQKVKGLREKAGLNQMQLAHFLEIDQSTISKCEKGERQFQGLAQVLDVPACGNKGCHHLSMLQADIRHR